MSRYALVGPTTGELLTYGGAVIYHTDRAEMEWLFPLARVVRISDGDLGGPMLRLCDHPDMQSVHFPLRREDFVNAR